MRRSMNYMLKAIFAICAVLLMVCVLQSGSPFALATSNQQTTYDCTAAVGIDVADCEVLVTFYNETGGPNWINNSGWLQTNTPCSWFGISCLNQRIAQLSMEDNRLIGSIPPELGELSNLTTLSLPINQLSGSIPPELGQISNLKTLWLLNNQLSESIPAELGQLSNLTELWLYSNQLSGPIPAALGELSNLTTLWLSSNQLSGSIPAELGQLTNLTMLSLSGNRLNGTIPPELGQLSNLTRVWLSSNQLSGTIPSELEQLSNLTYLGLYHNKLSGSVPAELGQLSSLTGLWLNNNQLSGPIPAEVGQLANLSALSLSSNQLSGPIPAEVGQLSNLTELYLYSNQLSGSIPAELGQLSNLTELYLYSNQLSGTIPSSLACLSTWPNLTNFDIDFNRFTAESPQAATCLDERSITWRLTQTVSPSNLQAALQSPTSVRLQWSPVVFTDTVSGGYYEVGLSVNEGAISPIVTTANKAETEVTLTGLIPGTFYSFSVRTFTSAHGGESESTTSDDQQNDLTSDWSESVSIVVPEATPVPPTATVPPTNTSVPPTATVPPTNTPVPLTATVPPTNTPVPLTPTPITDTFEDSNTCLNASSILADGMIQTHSFHSAGDVDWIKFEADVGVAYTIEIAPLVDSQADVDMELYTSCTDSLPQESWDERFTPGVRLEFSMPTSGTVFMKLVNADASIFGSSVAYEVSVAEVAAEPEGGAVIILAGRLKANDPLQRNIYYAAENFLQLFENNGYNADDIYYLAPEQRAGRDASATNNNLRLAITEWAKQNVAANQALTIYIIDHGDRDVIYIDELNQERLTPRELDEWLSIFEAAVPTASVNVIIEACLSGSFISGAESISKEGRVVITSTNADYNAYADREAGAYFSDRFVLSLDLGRNLLRSYLHAVRHVNQTKTFQEPWIDANGNQIPGEDDDLAVAAQRGFAYAGTFSRATRWEPHIFSAEASTDLVNFAATITAEIRDDQGIDRAWATIYPPSYRPPNQGQELVDEHEVLESILLNRSSGDLFAARYSGFNQFGTYRIVIHAQDADGLQAMPRVIEVTTGVKLFVPLMMQ